MVAVDFVVQILVQVDELCAQVEYVQTRLLLPGILQGQ